LRLVPVTKPSPKPGMDCEFTMVRREDPVGSLAPCVANSCTVSVPGVAPVFCAFALRIHTPTLSSVMGDVPVLKLWASRMLAAPSCQGPSDDPLAMISALPDDAIAG